MVWRMAQHHPHHTRTRKLLVAVAVLLGVGLLGSACASDDNDNDDGNATVVEDNASDNQNDVASDEEADGPVFGDRNGTDPLPLLDEDIAKPLIFVHGFAGSAQQFESQAMRLVANGYPMERIIDYDHDGAGLDIEAYAVGLGEVVDATLERFDADTVYLVGHSRGTRVSSEYLSNPENAAKVAKYVAIDGFGCVDAVPCLAPTQIMFPGEAHVEVASSEDSFVAQYEFLTGEAPVVTEIVAQREPVEISGRAVEFPANVGRGGATLNIWPVEESTGHRSTGEPHATFELGEDGAFGPVQLVTGGFYEYELTTADSDTVHHLYVQPYLRSSNFVRLLSSQPDGDIRERTNTSPEHSTLLVMRMKEWYGVDPAPDSPAAGVDGQIDQLLISVDGAEPVNVITPDIGRTSIGLHLHDDTATPGETTLTALESFVGQPFQSSADIFMPASPDGSGTISVVNNVRGDTANPQQINVANWPSDLHTISVVFFDYKL